jgi:hypothetical protein
MATEPSITQNWLRDYSRILLDSYIASGRIEHAVTKGTSRERQILDALKNLLPTRVSVETNTVVIVNSKGSQSLSFDGALVNHVLWPRIFAQDYTVVMLESVIAGIEVKSSLNQDNIQDIFAKSRDLRSMRVESGKINTRRPIVTAFAFDCRNINLTFFDFATLLVKEPDLSPSLVCVLNNGLFGITAFENGVIAPLCEPQRSAIPVLYYAQQDSLLVYLYFLSQWVTEDIGTADIFRRYSDYMFAEMECFRFDDDFIAIITSDEGAYSVARDCFKGTTSKDIEIPYSSAREKLGLPARK